MTQSDEATLAYWKEHREQLRQSENQRATLTNYVIVITAALSAFVAQQNFGLNTLPCALLIAAVGAYGAIATAKFHERAEYHLLQARALTQALKDSGVLASNDALVAQYRDRHYRTYPRLHKLRLHFLWTGLHIGIVVFGLVLAALAVFP
jgi:hypothetical protein